MSTHGPALSTCDLCVGYDATPVVEHLDITVPQGQSLALVGTNGCGKSTLLKTIVGLLAPVSGSIEVLGDQPGKHPRSVAYLGQFHAARFVLPLQALDVVRMGRFASLGLFRRFGAEDDRLVRAAMEHFEVTPFAGQPLRSLSGGQQQRVHLAQLMARHADVLVLDEPTVGLDLSGRERYRQMFDQAQARGASVITATHDIAEASTCDQVVLLSRRVVAQGAPADVLTADNLLTTFGIALVGLEHHGHQDLLHSEQPHAHEHGHGHDHGHEPGHGPELPPTPRGPRRP
jgi:ABC-type Mn2+/Zn2+ transport system ATPase subunit